MVRTFPIGAGKSLRSGRRISGRSALPGGLALLEKPNGSSEPAGFLSGGYTIVPAHAQEFQSRVDDSMISHLWDGVSGWWREATGPMNWHSYNSVGAAVMRRVLLWIPVVVVFLALTAATGVYLLTGWRARDLAAKGMENARSGNLSMAQLQLKSAARLRGWDGSVQRAEVFVQSRLNDPGALGRWRALSETAELTSEEMEERARLAMVRGSDAEFEEALVPVPPGKGAALRSARLLQMGDLTGAIAQARAAAGASDEPAHQLELARLLIMGQTMAGRVGAAADGPRAEADEIVGLIDQLRGTASANQAIALGLGSFPQSAEKSREWALDAMGELEVSNPALLAAAHHLAASGGGNARELAQRMTPVFAGADPGVQARLARWLNAQGLWDETLALMDAKTASQDFGAYEARAHALAVTGKWDDLLALSDSPARAPASFRLTIRSLAAQRLGKSGIANKALADALAAGAQDGRIREVLLAADQMNQRESADAGLVALCSDPRSADVMLRVARDRFGRRGQFESVAQAYANASRAVPHALPVQDYRRRLELLEARSVPAEETAAAVEASPADPSVRCTHALNLLRNELPREALAVLQGIDLVPERLAPGDQAVVIAVLAANGLDGEAGVRREALDPRLLEEGERALVGR